MAEAAKELEGEGGFNGFDEDGVGAEIIHGPFHIAMLGAPGIVEAMGLEFRRDAFVELGKIKIDEAAI